MFWVARSTTAKSLGLREIAVNAFAGPVLGKSQSATQRAIINIRADGWTRAQAGIILCANEFGLSRFGVVSSAELGCRFFVD
jgi:hypothetical protein